MFSSRDIMPTGQVPDRVRRNGAGHPAARGGSITCQYSTPAEQITASPTFTAPLSECDLWTWHPGHIFYVALGEGRGGVMHVLLGAQNQWKRGDELISNPNPRTNKKIADKNAGCTLCAIREKFLCKHSLNNLPAVSDVFGLITAAPSP